MANYLLKTDFNRYITTVNLDKITETNDKVWEDQLLSSTEVAASFMRFRYDTDREFAPIDIEHSLLIDYLINERVEDSGNLYVSIQAVPIATPITDTDFWDKTDDRNQAIVDVIVVLVLYAVYSRINGSEIPNWIQVLFDGGDMQARGGKMGYLKDIRKGTVQIDLELLPEVADGTDQSGNNIAFGSAVGAVNRNTSI